MEEQRQDGQVMGETEPPEDQVEAQQDDQRQRESSAERPTSNSPSHRASLTSTATSSSTDGGDHNSAGGTSSRLSGDTRLQRLQRQQDRQNGIMHQVQQRRREQQLRLARGESRSMSHSAAFDSRDPAARSMLTRRASYGRGSNQGAAGITGSVYKSQNSAVGVGGAGPAVASSIAGGANPGPKSSVTTTAIGGTVDPPSSAQQHHHPPAWYSNLSLARYEAMFERIAQTLMRNQTEDLEEQVIDENLKSHWEFRG
ncbi:unnamed protein product [Amoebophrya sp. A25]|nr:unnamed protein product [Amoebophrya sp. A25]|eukprot:GSA25T00002464001.1